MPTENEVKRRGLEADTERFRAAANAAERLGVNTMTTVFRDWVTILEAKLRLLDRLFEGDE